MWRAFPWDARAAAGTRFSSDYLPDQSGQGRFDLPPSSGDSSWYFAETPEHAAAEKIQDLRNRVLHDDHLFEWGHRLAVVPVTCTLEGIVDFCNARDLVRHRVAPDRLAGRDRDITQEIAARVHEQGEHSGLRWWSSFFGEWHTVVLFSDRVEPAQWRFGVPEPLHAGNDVLHKAAEMLGIRVSATRPVL